MICSFDWEVSRRAPVIRGRSIHTFAHAVAGWLINVSEAALRCTFPSSHTYYYNGWDSIHTTTMFTSCRNLWAVPPHRVFWARLHLCRLLALPFPFESFLYLRDYEDIFSVWRLSRVRKKGGVRSVYPFVAQARTCMPLRPLHSGLSWLFSGACECEGPPSGRCRTRKQTPRALAYLQPSFVGSRLPPWEMPVASRGCPRMEFRGTFVRPRPLSEQASGGVKDWAPLGGDATRRDI